MVYKERVSSTKFMKNREKNKKTYRYLYVLGALLAMNKILLAEKQQAHCIDSFC